MGAAVPLPALRVLRNGSAERADRSHRSRRRRQERQTHPQPHRHQRHLLLHHPVRGTAIARGQGLQGDRQFGGHRHRFRHAAQKEQRARHGALSGGRRCGRNRGQQGDWGKSPAFGRLGGRFVDTGFCHCFINCLYLQSVSTFISSLIL